MATPGYRPGLFHQTQVPVPDQCFCKAVCEAKFEIETWEDPGNKATQMFDFLACAVLFVNFKQLLRLLPKLSNLWMVMWWEANLWSLFMDMQIPSVDMQTPAVDRETPACSRHPDSSSWQNCHSTQSLPVYIPCPVFSISWSGLIRHLSALVSFPSYIFRWKVIWVRDYMSISFQLQAASYTSRAEWWLCWIPMS